MFKYKDLRMLVFTSIISIFLIIGMILFGLDGQRSKLIIGSIILIILLGMILTKYNARIMPDSMMIYHFMYVGILPDFIEFKDITDYHLISKHKFYVKTTHEYTLYLVNANAFNDEFEETYKKYQENKINTEK
ncbi:MAG: hypothetical protein PHH04_05275 [Thomasclavelia sp.]|nr:hypothetical protein [Thomasclavelia sp.]